MRLFHQLFLLVAATALLSALAMAAVLSLNLKRGFDEYLEARDTELLDGFTRQLSSNIAASGGATAVSIDQISLQSVFQEMIRNGDVPGAPADFRVLLPNDRPTRHLKGPKPPPSPQNFARRLMLFDVNGIQVVGPPPPPFRNTFTVRRSIRVNGSLVGEARLLPFGPTPSSVDASFLRGQYIGAAALTGLLLIFAAFPAYFLARSGAKRLTAVRDATDAIAGGDFSARLSLRGKDELAAVGQNINEMAQSLATLEGARKRWLAEIGHELRTPLTILRGELDAMTDGIRPLDETAIVSLSEEVERLSVLVDDFHFLSVSDVAGPNYIFSEFDLLSLVANMEARFGEQMRSAGIGLTLDKGALNTLTVHWDQRRIEQLLGNLFTNACRYTDAPGTVRLTLGSDQGNIEICVEDSAPGVPPESLPFLFEPLFRVEASRDRASGGSGLGLAVCKAIAAAHGGTITAAPSELGGLSITLRIPNNAGSA